MCLQIVGFKDNEWNLQENDILVDDHHTVKIEGELTDAPAFYADMDSVKNWDFSYKKEIVIDEEKREIVRKFLE